MYNLKEIAVRCETVEQKKLVAKIMSEELNYKVTMSDYNDFNYICSSPYMSIKDYMSAPGHSIIPYSDFIKHYPKHLIQSGDIVELTNGSKMRAVQVQDYIVLINDNDWRTLDIYNNDLSFGNRIKHIDKIIRPSSNKELSELVGLTIWQRKSEAEIKREEIQSQIEALKKELEELK